MRMPLRKLRCVTDLFTHSSGENQFLARVGRCLCFGRPVRFLREVVMQRSKNAGIRLLVGRWWAAGSAGHGGRGGSVMKRASILAAGLFLAWGCASGEDTPAQNGGVLPPP